MHDIGMGSMDKESSFKLLNVYFDNGGNFIDTANNYQDETSEGFIGEWVEKRGIRDQLFIATKFTSSFKLRNNSVEQKVLFVGNSTKALHISVEASLKKLRTSYIDLLYLHWWDWDTSVEEVMKALHTLILQGKVLYLGVSDTPAWVVAKANQYARDHALTPFVIYQGMALAPFRVLAGGKIRTDEEEEQRRQTGEKGRTVFKPEWERNDQEKAVCKALEKVAAETGAKHINAVAIAYLMHKAPYVFPIIGGRKVEHLLANIEALEVSLNDEQMKYLDSIVPLDPGFPNSMIGDGTEVSRLMVSTAAIDLRPTVQPVRHHSRK
ncbi:NADP-dependent oxidoreductase domain-containing protein [Flammula alnicola]|nr:NADP-dependent oxidoreductase domain-containing protein [Flammula alnicola]